MGTEFELDAFIMTLTLAALPASGRLKEKITLSPFFSKAVISGTPHVLPEIKIGETKMKAKIDSYLHQVQS